MPDLGLEPGPQKITARKDIMGQLGQVECGLGIRQLCCFNVKFPELDTCTVACRRMALFLGDVW